MYVISIMFHCNLNSTNPFTVYKISFIQPCRSMQYFRCEATPTIYDESYFEHRVQFKNQAGGGGGGGGGARH